MKADLLASVRTFVATEHQLFVGGEPRPAHGGARFDVQDPASGAVLTTVARAGAADVDDAVAAARAALPGWRRLPAGERGRLLWELGNRIEALAAEFLQLEALDNGKPTGEAAAVDVPLTANGFRYFGGLATKIEGVTIPTYGGLPVHVSTRREPVGVVAAIIPWNFPLLNCAYKLAPALAAGNTVVLKPAEQTPLSALRLAQLAAEVGFPPGVLNVLTGFGPEAGAPLAAHPDVDKITFTGENSTGRSILAASGGTMKRVSLELGGKSPSLVFADADLDAAVEGTFGAVYFNQGQCCVAGARIFVQRPVYDAFVEALAARVHQVRLGSGLDPATTMGPLVSASQRDRVLGLVRSGLAAGAKPVVGGATDPAEVDGCPGGYFVEPTLFVDAPPDSDIMRREIFGPVGMVAPFDTEQEAVALANDTEFGLAAGVWTRDVGRAHRVSDEIRAGVVWVNIYGWFDVAVPFGGFRASGYGKEHGIEALDAYLQTKAVWMGLS
ncbi:aldehyde dehydrogenase [Parafrankia sp. EUN1f]|uniref:aldehyde dehydrogenase family protein n=1 Tax=Parafrankia sp. EUN1f TaxID=102897 RepID=UPI0001C43E46|nr:aldehyde dehydrogenase family protein [Parafrankia sp. EUN1f]EFC85248.1 Aldehyde Dehydrogenase [Parafrankia sp. EUN1f]